MMKKIPFIQWFSAPFSNKTIAGVGYLLAFGVFPGTFSGCNRPEKEKYELLKIYGNGQVGNFSKNYILYTTQCHVGKPGGLMAEPGDMLWMENWILINEPSIKTTDGSIHLIESDSLLMVNGITAGILIDSAYRPSQLLDLNKKEAIQNLKVMTITPAGLSLYPEVVEKIASINPGCILQVTGDFKDSELKWLFDHCAPTVLSIDLHENQQNLLETEQQLENLFISNNDSIYTCQPLPSLPKLHDLYFLFDGNEVAASPENKNWLNKNPQVKTLILTDWNEAYPKGLLAALKAPEVLIMGGMQIPAQEIMAHSATLKRVMLDSAELQMELPGVKGLFVFNSEKPQLFINNIAQKKPDCDALEIFATNQKLDLSPLLPLKNLASLTLMDADSISIAPLLEMKQLKLLSYSTDSTNMDSTIAVLQSALPGTLVVANQGLCLGSGWLMAWVPALIASMGFAVFRRRKKPSSI
jgi:hypothetical protein